MLVCKSTSGNPHFVRQPLPQSLTQKRIDFGYKLLLFCLSNRSIAKLSISVWGESQGAAQAPVRDEQMVRSKYALDQGINFGRKVQQKGKQG
jgi:hypothetical protein